MFEFSKKVLFKKIIRFRLRLRSVRQMDLCGLSCFVALSEDEGLMQEDL